MVSAPKTFRRLALQGLSGALVWGASPALGEQFWLAGFALTPFLLSLHGLSARAAASWGFSGGLFYIIPGKWTTFANAGAVMGQGELPTLAWVLLFFSLFAIPFAVFAVLWQRAARWQCRPAAPWACGFGWAALILLLPTVFPYTPAAMISGQPLLIQLADLGGEPLVLGLLLTANAGFAHAILHGRIAAFSAVSAVLLPVTAALAYGVVTLPLWQAPAAEELSVLALQARWPRTAGDSILLRDSARARPLSAVELTRAGLAQAPECQLVIWPESTRAPILPESVCARAAELAAEYGRPLLASCHGRDERGRYFAARLFTPTGLAGEHRKSRLIPLYEAPALPEPDGLLRGGGPDVLDVDGLPPLAPLICYEMHFRHDLRTAVRDGAGIFVHMANFAMFRLPRISVWDLAMARLRAVELRRAVVRSVNAGVAGMVLPTGAWVPGSTPGTSGATCHRAPLSRVRTIYARFGDALFWLLSVVAAAALRLR